MSKRGTRTILSLLTLASAACGGGGEQRIIDQYFGALRAGDNQTLTSFALVHLDQKVDSWKVANVSPETKAEAPLPELVKKAKDLEAQVAANQKAYHKFVGENIDQASKVKDLQRAGKPIPASLSQVAAETDRFNAEDRRLKKAAAEAKAAAEKERQRVGKSVGNVPELDSLTGKVLDKQVDVVLTIGGQPKNYAMGLRKYELTGGTGPSPSSRWIVTSLSPK